MAAAEVARLVARLEADVRDFDRDIKKATKRLDGLEKQTKQSNAAMKSMGAASGKLGGAVKKLGLAIGGAFIAKQIIDFASDSIRAFSDLEESVNAVEVTFGAAAEGIKQLGEEAAITVGLSNSAFNSLAVGFSAFVDKITAGGGDVVQTMDDLTTRVADFASVMNLDVQEAGNIFRSALAGETEAIRRFGVDVSAVAVQAKAMALGLAESSSELTEQDKILARYQLVMEQTEKTAGDFANTSDSLANRQRVLQARLEDTQARIGEGLVPIMLVLLDTAEKAIPLLDGFAKVVGRITGTISRLQAVSERMGLDPSSVKAVAASFKDLSAEIEALGRFTFGHEFNEMRDGLTGILEEADLTFDELMQLRGGIDGLTREMGLNGFQAETLARIIQKELIVKAFGESRQPLQNFGSRLGEIREAFGATRQPIHNFVGDVKAAQTELNKTPKTRWIDTVIGKLALAKAEARNMRQAILELTSPFISARNSTERAEEALVDYNAAVDSGDPGAIEDATFALIDANIEAQATRETLDQIAAEDFHGFISAIDTMGDSIDMPLDQMLALLETAGILDGTTVRMFFEMTALPIGFTDPPPTTELRDAIEREARLARIKAAEDLAIFNDPDAVGQRARGGPVAAGSPFIVGEQGPELFVPSQSGQIIPNDQMGGANITLNVGEMTEDLLDETIEDLLGASLTLNAETR